MKFKNFALIIILYIVVLTTSGCSVDESPDAIFKNKNISIPTTPATPITKSVAPDFTLKTLTGEDFTLSSLKGKKVVLCFFASWCPHCVDEFKGMKPFYPYIKQSTNTAFYAVNLQEDEDTVKKFVEDYSVQIPVLLDTDREVSDKYNVQGIPTTIIIDKDGTILKTFQGAVKPEELTEYIK